MERIVHSCEEHQEVTVNLGELLDGDKLDVYPEVSSRGYFDIAYRRGVLLLRATKYVGYIPLNDRVAIHVKPRAPISNLLYMVSRSGERISGVDRFVRAYADMPHIGGSPEDLYLDTFLSALSDVARTGVLKTYRRNKSETEKKGRLLLTETVSRFRAKGIRHKHVFVKHEFSVDNAANRIVKHTGLLLLQYLKGDTSKIALETVRKLKKLLSPLSTVNETRPSPIELARSVYPAIRSLPSDKASYQAPLWLSYLIIAKRGVAIDQFGASQFSTVIMDVSAIFEHYVQRLCFEVPAALKYGWTVANGNSRPWPLFVRGDTKISTKPDVYFTRIDGKTAVVEVKYKKGPNAADRYELLGFCAALGAKHGVFVCPTLPQNNATGHYGTTIDGIKIDIIRVNLNSDRWQEVEQAFHKDLTLALELDQE